VSRLIGMSSKMNLTSTEAGSYLDTLVPLVAELADRRIFVLFPFTAIWMARDRLAGTAIRWGAQDVHPEDAGAHTGDVSAPMLADLGCSYIEVGHNERRRDHGETDELVAAKVGATQRGGMTAIVCIGEPTRRSLSETVDAIGKQVRRLSSCDASRLVVAYEPAWAIGEGARAASPDWVGSVHRAIRELLGSPGLAPIPIIYGGSVGPVEASALLAQPAVDGLFVGRKALDPAVFSAIAHAPVGR
jgi:triosephosphate isomerase